MTHPERDPDNVWAQVQHRAREWMDAGTPVYTLSQDVPNQIIGVDDSQVRRRSAQGHTSNDQTAITRGMITSLWRELVERGETGEVRLLRFAYALLQRSIAGIAFEPAPRFRLVLVDPDEANRPFVPGGEEVPGLTEIPPSPARRAHAAVARAHSTRR